MPFNPIREAITRCGDETLQSPAKKGRGKVFAINHAATALLVKRKYPEARMLWLLISVQLMELLWVIFNYFGVEITTTEKTVKSLLLVGLWGPQGPAGCDCCLQFRKPVDAFKCGAKPRRTACGTPDADRHGDCRADRHNTHSCGNLH